MPMADERTTLNGLLKAQATVHAANDVDKPSRCLFRCPADVTFNQSREPVLIDGGLERGVHQNDP